MNFYIIAASVLSLLNACASSGKSDDSQAYSLTKRHILPEKLQETSGIIKHRGLIWTFNDSGGKNEIYGFNLSNDSIEQTISINNAINNDWEDIAQDDDYLYIGDFGNNMGKRDSLVIYKIAKVLIPKKGNASVSADILVFSYPGYEAVSVPVSFSAFDCEAFVVIKDSLYLFTKDWTDGTSTIYSLPKMKGKYTAKKINKINSQGLVTGADYENNKLLIIGYANFEPYIMQFTATDLSTITDAQAKRYELTNLATYQTEGICFDGKNIFISSEKTRSPAQIIELKMD